MLGFGDDQSVWGHLVQAWDWFLHLLTPANLIQIPAVILAGAAAWVLTRPLQHSFAGWVNRQWPASLHLDWLERHRDWLVGTVAPLIPLACWMLGLWLSIAVAQVLGWPHDVARIATNLLLAWLVIRLASDLIPYAALARLLAILVWSVAALNIVHLLEPVLAVLDSVALEAGGLRISILTVVKGVLILSVLLWGARLASGLLERRLTRMPELTPIAQVLLGKLLKTTLFILAVVVALASAGIDMSVLAVFGGAVGVGLGLQKTASNLFSGFILLLDKSIKPGDVIEVGGTYGWVSSLGARYVSVETRDGTEFLIPNEDIITQQVINWSHRNALVRLRVPVRVDFECDLDLALSLLRQAAQRSTRVLAVPPPNALVLGFGESAIDLELRFWIADARNGVRNVKSAILLETWKLFREHGIRIPYARREVFVHQCLAEVGSDDPETRAVQ
jgi:small-conductance mechanosensitive channel